MQSSQQYTPSIFPFIQFVVKKRKKDGLGLLCVPVWLLYSEKDKEATKPHNQRFLTSSVTLKALTH